MHWDFLRCLFFFLRSQRGLVCVAFVVLRYSLLIFHIYHLRLRLRGKFGKLLRVRMIVERRNFQCENNIGRRWQKRPAVSQPLLGRSILTPASAAPSLFKSVSAV
jgi:hypothetical protein